eukprot:scaffold3882_cov164-Amphora_coffeaeformis.AAC.9
MMRPAQQRVWIGHAGSFRVLLKSTMSHMLMETVDLTHFTPTHTSINHIYSYTVVGVLFSATLF